MKSQIIAVAVVVLVILLAIIFWPEKEAPKIEESQNIATTSANITVPSQSVSVPDVNPVNKANPFSDVKTNPFD